MTPAEIKTAVEAAWDKRDALDKNDHVLRSAVEQAIRLLDSGKARVAEPSASGPPEAPHPAAPAALGHPARRWVVNQWLKKAVLLYFRLHDNQIVEMTAL